MLEAKRLPVKHADRGSGACLPFLEVALDFTLEISHRQRDTPPPSNPSSGRRASVHGYHLAVMSTIGHPRIVIVVTSNGGSGAVSLSR